MANLTTEHPHFFTATNLEWKRLLQSDNYKEVITGGMKHLVKEKRVDSGVMQQ